MLDRSTLASRYEIPLVTIVADGLLIEKNKKKKRKGKKRKTPFFHAFGLYHFIF